MLLSVACPAVPCFSTLIHKLHDHLKKIIEQKCVSTFSTTVADTSFRSKKSWARCDHKCILALIQSTRDSCQMLWNLKFCRQIFERYSNIKCHENPSSGIWTVSCGRTDGRTDGRKDGTHEANCRFRNFAKAPKSAVLSHREQTHRCS